MSLEKLSVAIGLFKEVIIRDVPLKVYEVSLGDIPKMSKVLKNISGTIIEKFFNDASKIKKSKKIGNNEADKVTDILSLFEDHADDYYKFISISLREYDVDIVKSRLSIDESVTILKASVEVNKDLFLKKLVPQLNQIMDEVKDKEKI